MSAQDITLDEYWSAVDAAAMPSRPPHALSAAELCKRWSCSQMTAKRRADLLVSQGKLNSLQIKEGAHYVTVYFPKEKQDGGTPKRSSIKSGGGYAVR